MTDNKKRVFVGGLPPGVRLRDIRQLFTSCGPVIDIYIDKKNSRYAFVQFENESDARLAVRRLDGEKLLNARIKVEASKKVTGKDEQRNFPDNFSANRREIIDEGGFDRRQEEEEIISYRNFDQPENFELASSLGFMSAPLLETPPFPTPFVPQQQRYDVIREERPENFYPPPIQEPLLMTPRETYQPNFAYPPDEFDVRRANLRYDEDMRRCRDDSPCPPSPLPPSSSRERKIPSVPPATAGGKRKRSEEPEIYDVSKETKENPSLSRWMNYCKSLAERLDKMGEKQQAYARMKIEEAMYQAEFGPYSTAGSGSQAGACTGTLYPVGFLQQS